MARLTRGGSILRSETDDFGRAIREPEEKPKRHVDPSIPMALREPVEPTMPESDRLAQRKKIRSKIALAKLHDHRRHEAERLIELANIGKLQAADRHTAATAPIQASLKRIDDAQVKHMLAEGAIDQKLEDERRALLANLRAANETLEKEIEALDADIRHYSAERYAEATQSAWTDLERELSGRLANPEIAEELRVARIWGDHTKERELIAQLTAE